MPRYFIYWTEEVWHRSVIEADTEEDAYNIYWEGEFDFSDDKITGGEVQDKIEIVEDK